MTLPQPGAAPVLSTPDTHIFDQVVPQVEALKLSRLDDERLYMHYEIERTIGEIRSGKWKRIALQFPDHMLVDAPRVFQALSRGLKQARRRKSPPAVETAERKDEAHPGSEQNSETVDMKEKLFVLADTSYGACCVDEVAAEHAEADVVVHYGRSCLSPTARLPVIYVFTKPPLDLENPIHSFKATYVDLNQKIILMADIPYSGYLNEFARLLRCQGYSNIFVTSVIHDTTSPLPNRTVPSDVMQDAQALQNYQLFHISDPPPALLLTLASRVEAIHIYSTEAQGEPRVLLANSSAPLRRRYALITRVSNAAIIGILINTLSVRSYLDILQRIKANIAAAGKKSYTFVVGKVNAAKIANFSEVDGWVVVGCWESSLFDNADFWKPVITPWELEIALKGDEERLWTGMWRSDFEEMLSRASQINTQGDTIKQEADAHWAEVKDASTEGFDSEEESEPPEFDLRTGRYVSHTRLMRTKKAQVNTDSNAACGQKSLVKRPNGELATVGGQVSPAAEFLRSKRTWQGLGSDFNVEHDEHGAVKLQEPAIVEAGRSGIARGYRIPDSAMEYKRT